jgi:hypothetical protein
MDHPHGPQNEAPQTGSWLERLQRNAPEVYDLIWFPTLPLVDYTYQVNGQTQDGSATGLPIKDDQINQTGDVMDSLPALSIRYDPDNPQRSRILNEDNPLVPFKIDHLAH